jgi:LPXTG-site transpeptidase (sortase) family protein
MSIFSKTKKLVTEVFYFAKAYKPEFFAAWLICAVLVFFSLFAFGLIPDWNPDEGEVPPDGQQVIVNHADASSTVSAITRPGDPAFIAPVRIEVPKIGLESVVLTPNSLDVKVLDEALLHGVVHYPISGGLGDISNMLIFGHSSHLPRVQNQNFKIFNDLSLLNIGDEVKVYSKDRVYIYKVSLVRAVSAEEALVEFSSKKKKITLSTCDTFGKKSDRFVVEADFVESRPL